MYGKRYAIVVLAISILLLTGCNKIEEGNSSLSLLLGSFMSAAEPTFDLPEGWYTEPQTVTISCETDDAIIAYTTDGTDPKTSITAVEDTTVLVDEDMTVQAYAYAGSSESATVSITYRISDPKNICLLPPNGGGNPNFPKSISYTITGPESFGPATFTQWRFDVDGNGTWDQDWQEGNTFSHTYAAAGMNTVRVEATDGTRYWLFDDNHLRVTEGVATNFAFNGTGTLSGVYNSSIAQGDIDGDGDLDLILTGNTGVTSPVSIIYQNDGTGSFTEINAGTLTAVYMSSTALGDIDGDGDLDLILTGWDNTNTPVSKIYQNDGTGTFSEINAGTIAGVRNSSVALGDLDSDGDLDLILTGTGVGITAGIIYQNDGYGSFTEIHAGTLTGVLYSSIALGDLDGDHDLDLILTGQDSGSARVSKIYQNNGSGGFTEINPGTLTGVTQGSVVLGDIDGDSDLDLILAGRSSVYVAKIYQNNGIGSFTEINAGTLTPVRNCSTAMGDLDGDSDLDLVLTGEPDSGDPVSRIYQNNGSGSFTEINSESITPVSDSSIALGDIDGDGNLDLVLTGQNSGGGGVSKIYLAESMERVADPEFSPSGGGFWASQNVTITTTTPSAHIIYTTNGSDPLTGGIDGGESPVIVNVTANTTIRAYASLDGFSNSRTKSAAFNIGFTEINSGTLTPVSNSSTALGDLDGDGDLDLILAGISASGRVSRIYRNDGSGSFAEINTGTITGISDGSIALGDLDGDGDLDLILTGYIGPGTGSRTISRIYQNDGTGTFTEINAGDLTAVSQSSVALGDLDGDSDLDLILTGSTSYSSPNPVSRIYKNDGNGSFTEMNAGDLVAVSSSSVALGDLDGDTDLDLILTGWSTDFDGKIYQNDGAGSFTEINAGDLVGVLSGSVALGDIDSDSDLDLIVTGYSDVSNYDSRIYQNDGSGSFTEINPGSLTGASYSSIALGDIDGEGDLDLIITGLGGSGSLVYLNGGTGSFTQITDSLANVCFSSIALGDINGDSALDLILAGRGPLVGTYAAHIYAGP